MQRELTQLGQKLQMMAEVEAVKARIEAMKAYNRQNPENRGYGEKDFYNCENEILDIINKYR